MNERDIFITAIQKEDPSQRRAYLDDVCRADEALRRGVEVLLEIHERAGSFLEHPIADPAATVDEPVSTWSDTLIGPYRLLEQIGEGGFGVVFLAEQSQPVRRKVALKILKPGMDTRQVVARFEAERQALALMDHPNIAHVFDGGETASGRSYFVMELVPGIPITDFCAQNQLGIRERLKLFVNLCQAVQHAHQKGIIHRDLKPSNVLITMQDAVPVVKVIDFGVAKALGQEPADQTLFTRFGQMVGTPLYMAPEQAGQSGLDVDTRSDIYSLGVLLYELLTGTTPFPKERFQKADYEEIRRILREEEPPRPSTRLSTRGQAATTVSLPRGNEANHLSQILRGELDWIVMKALEKDRNRRYETVNGLAADVQRYLNDEPVQACPPTAWYRFRKFTRRNKAMLTTATAVAAALLVGIGSLIGTVTVLAQSNEQSKQEKEEVKKALTRERQTSNELRQVLYRHGVVLALRERLANNVARAEQLLDECPGELREWEWHYVQRLCRAGKRLLHGTATAPVTCVAYSPNGQRVAAGRRNGVVDVWDVATGRLEVVLGNHTDIVRDLAFSADSRFLTSVAEDGGGVHISDLTTGQMLHTLPTLKPTLRKISYSPDARYLAASDTSGFVHIWDMRTRKILAVLPMQRYAVLGLAFHPKDKQLAAADLDGKVKVWAFDETGFWSVLTFPTQTNLRCLTWSPQGEWLVTSADDQTVRLWDPSTGSAVRTLWGHGGGITATAFRPDGHRLASASHDKSVKLWDPATGQELLTLHGTGPGAPDAYPAVAFSPDGDHLVTGSEQLDAVAIWDANLAVEARTLPQGGSISSLALAFSPDSTQIASVGPPGQTVVVRDAGTGRQLFELKGHKYWVRSLAYSPDGKLLAAAGGDWGPARGGRIAPGREAEIKVWRLDKPRELFTLRGPPGAYTSVAFTPDGKRLAAVLNEVGKKGEIEFWDCTSGEKLQTWRETGAGIGLLAFSPSEPRLVSALTGGVVKLWDTNTGQGVGKFQGHNAPITGLSLSRDGQLLATAADQAIKLWDVRTGNELRTLHVLPGRVHAITFSPNGKRLASTGNAGKVQLWDLMSGQEVLSLPGGGWTVAFSPDGNLLASPSKEGVRLWQIAD